MSISEFHGRRRTRHFPCVLALVLLAGLIAPCAGQEADVAAFALPSDLVNPAVPAVEAATTAAPQADAAVELVIAALNFLDVRYRRGGDSVDEGFDCSGFTQHVVSTVLGITLPRRSSDQAQQAGLPAVVRQSLKPGDLVFFNTLRRAFSHVGIYIGEGRFIHAPRSGQQVRLERMDTPYWTQRFDGARRISPQPGS